MFFFVFLKLCGHLLRLTGKCETKTKKEVMKKSVILALVCMVVLASCNVEKVVNIGSGLKISRLRKEKADLFESLELFYRVFVLGETEEQ